MYMHIYILIERERESHCMLLVDRKFYSSRFVFFLNTRNTLDAAHISDKGSARKSVKRKTTTRKTNSCGGLYPLRAARRGKRTKVVEPDHLRYPCLSMLLVTRRKSSKRKTRRKTNNRGGENTWMLRIRNYDETHTHTQSPNSSVRLSDDDSYTYQKQASCW